MIKKLKSMLALIVLFSVSATLTQARVVLNVQDGEEIRYLDPQKATGVGSAHIGINLFAGLYEYHHKTGEPTKEIAKSFTKNKDSSVWTFKLRDDFYWVSYKNGKVNKERQITADDVVYSYRRMVSPALASEYAYMLFVIKNAEKINKGEIKDVSQLGVRKVDKFTVEITMEGSVPSFVSYLPHHSFHLVPKEPIEQHKEKWIESGKIWTSSAFAFKEWKLKERISVVKNPYYHGAKEVQPEEINFNFIGTYSTDAVRAFKAGKTDIDLMPPPTSEIAPLTKSGHLIAARQLGTYFVRVNITKHPGLKDKRVRKALALTLPRKKIVKYVMKTGQIPTYSFVPNAFKGYKPARFTNTKSYKARVKEAKKLLAEAGYPNGKGLPQINYLYNTAETHQKVAVVIAKAWKDELGVNAKPLNQEWKVYLNSQKQLDYDTSRSGWVADMTDPMNFLEMFITDGGNNNTGFSNKEYDKLINLARGENDLMKRNKIMEKAEAILMEELPVLPLFNYTSVNLAQKYIKGFYANKLDQHALKYVKIDLNARNKAQKRKQ